MKYCCHSPCGSVDWNSCIFKIFIRLFSHSPCGSVDWNFESIITNFGALLSLPLWECGLKSPWSVACSVLAWSLPLWECGLKLEDTEVEYQRRWSLPLWECGLKYLSHCKTCTQFRHSPGGSVDWNSTDEWLNDFEGRSLPLWECGLK